MENTTSTYEFLDFDISIRDNLELATNNELKEKLDYDEVQIWSEKLMKINTNNSHQCRRLVQTNKHIINFGHDGIFCKLGTIFGKSNLRKKTHLKDIETIIYSARSAEFLLNGPDDYDYRLYSCDKRGEFIWYLLKIRENLKEKGIPPIKIYFREEIELKSFIRKHQKKVERKFLMDGGEGIDITSNGFTEWREEQLQKMLQDFVETEVLYKCPSIEGNQNLNEDSFEKLKVLGRGGYGKIVLCRKKDDKSFYAIKIQSKINIIQEDHIDYIKMEKEFLSEMEHPFLVSLKFCFHSPTKIFFGMDFLQGGDMYLHHVQEKTFSEKTSKFYAAQIQLALGYLHQKNIVYRDLKLENIMFDTNGYIKLIDYGICKKLQSKMDKTFTKIGTPLYQAPEVILDKGHNMMADWWSFGILLYTMHFGKQPWYSSNEPDMLYSIVKDDFTFPDNIKVSDDCKDFITKLQTKNQNDRIGFDGGVEAIKSHAWFKDIDFEKLLDFEIEVPFLPQVSDEMDLRHFDERVRSESTNETHVQDEDKKIIKDFKEEFDDFFYVKD